MSGVSNAALFSRLKIDNIILQYPWPDNHQYYTMDLTALFSGNVMNHIGRYCIQY